MDCYDCTLPRFVFMSNILKFADMCKLQDCGNRVTNEDDDDRNNEETIWKRRILRSNELVILFVKYCIYYINFMEVSA